MMRKLIALLLALPLVLCSTVATAEGELSTTSKNVIIKIGSDSGIFVARVENTGDKPIYFDNGKLVVFSADDEILITENYITSLPSGILLQPDEYTYCYEFLWNSALKNAKIGDVKFSTTSDTSGYRYKQLPAEAEFEISGSGLFTYNYVNVTFTNTTDDVLYGVYAVVAVTDEHGNLNYVDGNNYDSLGVHPGSTVTLKMYIDRDYITYYETNGIKLSDVEALVYYEE